MPKIIEILDSDEDISNRGDTFVSPSARLTLTPKLPLNERSRNRRKDHHQKMRSSPDIQFETITLDDGEDETKTIGYFKTDTKTVSLLKSPKTTQKILGTKSTSTDDFLESAFNVFISNQIVQSKIKAIAEDRVRINFLLTSYGMPDIKFSLNTEYDRLKFQFEDRLKQRKIRNWNMNRQEELKIKKRRTL